MRIISILVVLAALATAPASGQSILPTDTWHGGGPNAQAAQRPQGPNARVAQRPVGPNAAITRARKLVQGADALPNCAQARAVRSTPIRRGEPGYGRHLDRDGDGVACR